ncbi:hypothetical protein DL96DRAFT_119880 [Flagelloscypha sp. PMI_526]|nr:hypothetical protein DL96DRAFT_119880 [Flagelloscypha sp. PMI_526]
MRFSLVTSVSILALPFTLAIPIGLLDNVKSGELVTFRKLSPFQSCGIVGPCFCDSTGCFQAISPAKTPGGDIMKVGKQDEVPVAPDDQISSTQQASPTTSAVDIRRR